MAVSPHRNLPGEAENWGRTVDAVLDQSDQSSQELSSRVSNSLRSNSGQAVSISNQIDDLYSRAIQLQVIPGISVTGGAQVEPLPRSTQFVAFTAPRVNTTALIQFSGELSTSNTSIPHIGFLEMTYGTSVVDRTSGDFARLAMKPAAWPNSLILEGFARVNVDAGISPSVGFTLIRRGSGSATSTTISITNLSVSLTYSGAPL